MHGFFVTLEKLWALLEKVLDPFDPKTPEQDLFQKILLPL